MGRAVPLYDTDFYAWTRQQAEALRRAGAERVNSHIDWDNVAEEIESMGRSDRRATMSHLARVIEHLLKLEHSPATEPRSGWRRSVVNHRIDADTFLRDSPSLRGRIDLAEAFGDARKLAAAGLEADGLTESDLPAECPYTLEQVLDPDWYPRNRHGVE